jgi:hypothetical protein
MWHNVRFAYSDLPARITQSAKSGPKLLCSKTIRQTTTVLSEQTALNTMDVHLLYFYCIRNKIYCIEMYGYSMYILQVHMYGYSTYILQVHMSTSDMDTVRTYSTGPYVH